MKSIFTAIVFIFLCLFAVSGLNASDFIFQNEVQNF